MRLGRRTIGLHRAIALAEAIRGYTPPPLAGKTAPDCGGKSIKLTKTNRSALPTDRTLRCFLERSDNTFSSASTSVCGERATCQDSVHRPRRLAGSRRREQPT